MLQNNKEPMPLEDLPEYLKFQRENGEIGNSPVVGMGQIVAKKSYVGLVQKMVFIMVMIVAVGIGSLVTYDVTSTKNITILMDIDRDVDPFQTIPKIVSDSGGSVINVKQNEDLTYEVKISTRKSKKSFLDWLRKNKNVNKASSIE